MFSKTSTVALVSAAVLAASAPAVVDASAKRGVAWPYFSNVAPSTAFGGAVAWLYDYETYLPPPDGSSFAGKEFICMQGKRGTGAQDSSPITQLASRCANQGSYVMGFNEPDQPESVGGSAISPQDAARLWQQYIQPLKNQGKKLVAPSVSAAQGDNLGEAWLDAFVAACQGCTFDAYG
ncbi:hypothetical protein IE81DRAFT_325803 [Ceraceosorus guamensis]|uniref:Asl1-like glycosyl hydrolase catalytic domain-containing protein n=1 Tax=Ceraceosorus guamensis TaxID=1522189 RepID=A0A316VS50_9BASI|nr:hypothetical protein IE81DRAFT_325803 [Ceraceosorus guamensis]PWN40190.1 hypothetical protein IE81DRAFT_325803 [Ceraceosorus guamensis]